jgi:hypothetical protein
MTSIKPSGGPPLPIQPSTTPAGQAGTAEQAGGVSFRKALESAASAGQVQQPAAAAPGSVAADPLAELAQAVRSGALTREQALERLVERALGSAAAGLTPAQRAELAVVLREALQHDPALRELTDALG